MIDDKGKIDKDLTEKDEIDKDLAGLGLCIRGMEMTRERMRAATLQFLLDKYVTHKKSEVKNGK